MPHIIEAGRLKKLSIAILAAAGTPQEESEIVAENIIRANLRGVDSHGVRNIPRYIDDIKCGKITPGVSFTVLNETSTTAMWDVNNAFGFVAGKKAMETAIEKAKQYKMGAVGTYNSKGGDDHVGALYYYSEMAAQKGMIGAVLSTSPLSRVAPWGGTKGALSVNPVSIAIPAENYPPIIFDISCTPVSVGHLAVMMARAESVPEGWLIDKEGKPTTDPQAFFAGGALLPFGTYKGYGLAVIIEAITGALGSGCSHDSIGFGHFYAALDPSGFVPFKEFTARIDGFIGRLKSVPPMSGVEEVFIPGEIENRTMEKRLKEGIPVDDTFWEKLLNTARELGINSEEVMG